MINMVSAELVVNWILWTHAVKFLQHDIKLVEASEVRFPTQYTQMIKLIGREAYRRSQDATKQLRQHRIHILGEKLQHGEYFLMWQYDGKTEMTRILESKLQADAQRKVEELMREFTAVRANVEPLPESPFRY